MSEEIKTYTFQRFRKNLSITIPKSEVIWGDNIKWLSHSNDKNVIDNDGEMPTDIVCTVISPKYKIGGLWILTKNNLK
tara:strand:- start:472 stop:705 length:234 start_codon:yes stop_codon:yes gene_type:complete